MKQGYWAHMILKVQVFMNIDRGKELSDEIHDTFRELKESPYSENIDDRESMKGLFDRRMEDMVRRYDP